MGILDSNIQKTQFREIRNANITLVEVTADINTARIDCRGYNHLLLSLLAQIEDQTVVIHGIYPDNTNTVSTPLVLMPVHVTLKNFTTPIRKPIKTVKKGYWQKFLIDVTDFDYISVNKLNAEGTLSYASYLSSIPFDETVFDFESYKTFKMEGTDALKTAVLDIPHAVKENAVIVKITTTAVINLFNSNPADNNFVRKWFNIITGEYLMNNGTLPIGTHFIAIPIEAKDSISLAGTVAANGVTSLAYKFVNFDFKTDAPRVYWESQTGQIGEANEYQVPKFAKYVKITLSGNSASIGMNVLLSAKKSSILSPNPNARQRYHLLTDKLIVSDKTTSTNSQMVLGEVDNSYYVSVEDIETIALSSFNEISNIRAVFQFYSGIDNEIKDKIKGLLTSNGMPTRNSYFPSTNLKTVYEDNSFVMLKDTSTMPLKGLLGDVAVWSDSYSLALSKNGIEGSRTTINLDATNFPNLIAGSSIEHVILLHWTRYNNTLPSSSWRVNVITTKGQVYHNMPSHADTHDGSELANDWITFEESVVWELETKTTPVKTKSGADATLIATGKYHYFPALPDECYEFHPAVSAASPHGNTGFPAVLTKIQNGGTEVKFSRFYFTDRSGGIQANPLGFMGGFETHPKLSMLATYKSNTDRPTRMCVFMTNDGGRQWFCRWEGGMSGALISPNDTLVQEAKVIKLQRNFTTNQMSAPAGSDVFNVIKRTQYVPDSSNKEIEKTKKFSYSTPIAVTSVTANASDITVVTSTAHGLLNGDVILIQKQNGTANEWDWIANTGYNSLSGGNGILFKAEVVNATTFKLLEAVGDANQNLTFRHIHSLNRCKDGYSFGCGEAYPSGWIFWIPVRESDFYMYKFPWDKFNFIRLNSTRDSVQRPLGITLEHDAYNTVFVGVDNEMTDLPNVSMPSGRTDTFKRSSNGAWKGRLVDIDNQSLFECVFDSQEVCYFFKKINGVFVYMGQQGHVGISKTGERGTWSEARAPWLPQRYGGINYQGWFVIDGLLFKIK